ncbi:uncharacterized protein LOC100186119 [Ciona intestinalis]
MTERYMKVIYLIVAIVHISYQQQEDIKPEVIGTCGGRYTGSRSGSFSSPGFPFTNYNTTANCTYEVEAPPGYLIAFQSTYMNVEPVVLGVCFDFVAVYKTGNLNDEPEKFCGSSSIPLDSTTGNRLIVIFQSDLTFNYPGFVVTWGWVDPSILPPVLECNFDGAIPLCSGWTQFSYDLFDWSLDRARQAASVTGIQEDHTTGTIIGRYAYITSEGRNLGDNAILLSPTAYVNDGEYCFNVWYRSTGDGYLYIIKVNSDGSAEYIFSSSTATNQDWRVARVPIPQTATPVQIAVEGISGSNSTLAIDDMQLSKGPCQAITTSTVTPRVSVTPRATTTQPTTTTEILTTREITTEEAVIESTTLHPAVQHVLNTLHSMFVMIVEWVRQKDY